jgi:hypothetical protein
MLRDVVDTLPLPPVWRQNLLLVVTLVACLIGVAGLTMTVFSKGDPPHMAMPEYTCIYEGTNLIDIWYDSTPSTCSCAASSWLDKLVTSNVTYSRMCEKYCISKIVYTMSATYCHYHAKQCVSFICHRQSYCAYPRLAVVDCGMM